jgi:hypothetical protein
MSIKDLLKNLAEGQYDGERTDSEQNGVSWGYYIDKGTPVKYREGKSSKFFDGKENIRTPGKVEKEYFDSDEKKTTFFQKYGFNQDMFSDHPDVMDYSLQYYDDKKKKK